MTPLQATPGPLKVGSRHSFDPGCVAVEPASDFEANDGKVIALCYGTDAEANANLIAAAPDLYEALGDTLSVCEYVLSKPDAYDDAFGQLVHAHVETARSALALARGEPLTSNKGRGQ